MKFAFTILICAHCFYSKTQEEILANKSNYQVEFNLKGAFLLPHSGAIKSLMNGTFPVYEFGAELPNLGNKHFHKNFPLNSWGVVFNFSPLTNNENLGFGFGILPYLNMNFLKKKESKWKFRLASGLGYIQKPFNNITNPKNMALGSYINNITDFTLQYQTRITGELVTKIGIGLQHFSNGAFTRPNLGLNLPYLSLSIKAKKKNSDDKATKPKITKEKNNFFIGSFYGTKTLTFSPAERHHVFQISGGYSLGFTRGDFIHLQTDIIFDESLPYLRDYDYELKSVDKLILGIFSTYEKKFGQIGTLIGLGFYILSPYESFTGNWNYANKGGYLYNRIGIKYHITKRVCAQVSARTHLGSADNTEFGIVYNLQ